MGSWMCLDCYHIYEGVPKGKSKVDCPECESENVTALEG